MNMSTQNDVNSQISSQELIEQPEIKENINQVENPSNIKDDQSNFVIHKYRDAPENFTKAEVISARQDVLSSGIDITNPKYANIITSRLTPTLMEKFSNHIVYSDKILPANDRINAIAVNSASFDGNQLNLSLMNSQVINGSNSTDAWGGDTTSSVASNSQVNRTYYSNTALRTSHDYNVGGYASHGNENLAKRYDRLVNDQGQLTKGVEKAFDNKGYPVLEAQAALQAYGSNRLCFTREAIVDLAYNVLGTQYVFPTSLDTERFIICPRNLTNKGCLPESLLGPQSLVSKAQTQDDFYAFLARYFCAYAAPAKGSQFVAPCTDWEWLTSADYIGFDDFENVEQYANRCNSRTFWDLPGDVLLYAVSRHLNSTNTQFVGYIDSNNQVVGKFGTIITTPTFTDVAGYNTYITDSAKFTPLTSSVTLSPAKSNDAYNVQDIYSAYCALAYANGKYHSPFGDMTILGNTVSPVTLRLTVCNPWYRVAHCLNMVEYDLDFSSPIDNYSVLSLNKLYHLVRYLFGLYLTGLTKIYGSAENVPLFVNHPRTGRVADRIMRNIYSLLTFSYIKPTDNNRYFLQSIVKPTMPSTIYNGVLFKQNGTYTPGTLFNNYGNTNLTGQLSSSTADYSYTVYLEDAQWWRGDIFGQLRSIDIKPIYSAGSSLSKIYQSPDGSTSVECAYGTYCSQSCDALTIDIWTDAYGSTATKKVRTINWNKTDTVVRFIQPVLWCWSSVVTAIKCAGIMSMITTNTFNPTILQASIPNWGELTPLVKATSSWNPEMDF